MSRIPMSSDRTEIIEYKVPLSCDQCEMLSINGVVCHETGCLNIGAKWEDGEWVKYYQCFKCGCDVRKGEVCSCFEPCEDEEEEEEEEEGTK